MISIVQWFVDGRKNYKGPQVELVGEGIMGDPNSHNGYADGEKMADDSGETMGEIK